MGLRQQILKAIDQRKENAHSTTTEPYEDNYDGFTHQTYIGLAEDVKNELDDEGIDNPTQAQIEDFVDQMI